MLRVPKVPSFGWHLSTATGQPAAAFGTSVTPGNNTYGTYAELIDGALVTDDVWAVRIQVNSNTVSGAARDTLLTIGIDPTAGTSYTDHISHLLVSDANTYTSDHGGVWYDFPFRIPAGSSIAAKASVNNATVGTLRCWMQLYGRPESSEVSPLGTKFRTFGEVTASSRGTLVTPGTTSEGAWTQLGSALTEPLWYWEVGYGCASSSVFQTQTHIDLAAGDASNKRLLLSDVRIAKLASETISKPPGSGRLAYVAAGEIIYGRMQQNGSVESNQSLIAYGVG